MDRATVLIAISSIIMPVEAAAPVPDVGWSAYGGDAGGTRYSTAAQITPANVGRLEVAWTFRTGELGQGVFKGGAFAHITGQHGRVTGAGVGSRKHPTA